MLKSPRLRERVLRYWTYFRRGHGTYLAFLLSFANFVAIQYRLVIENVKLLAAVFPRLTYFLLTFATIYVPVCTLIGWLDYKRGAVPIERALGEAVSPWNRDLARALMLICDGRYEEAKEILKRWA